MMGVVVDHGGPELTHLTESNSEPNDEAQYKTFNSYTCTSILISNRRVRWHAFFYSFQAPDTRPDTPVIRT